MALTQGSKGESVRRLQENLKAIGLYEHEIDGSYGRWTREAVIAFQQRYFVDGIADKSTYEAIERAVVAWSRRELKILLTVPNGLKEIQTTFGLIKFEEAGGGYVRVLDDWEERNIEFVDLPVVGVQPVHRKLSEVFTLALQEVVERGLDRKVLTFGTWCPRHKMHNSRRGLSTHAWGIACDINQATNLPGTVGDLDSGIVSSFERYGFRWGGSWKYSDPMHFQYATGY